MGVLIAAFFISAAFWYIELKYDPQEVIFHLKCYAVVLLWISRDALYSKSVHTCAPTWIIAIALVLSTTAYCVVRQCNNGKSASQTKKMDTATRTKTNDTALSHSLKPLIFPCRTIHARMFPKKHSFSYSYLLVGIPVGWHGSLGSLLSADGESCSTETEEIISHQQQRSWFKVEAADYLERGSHGLGLKGKLILYLKSQNEDPEEYAHAYLITAPKFLGYSFNPVSFWYLYTEQKELKAIILEVNNTFDERRMYFLKNTDDNGMNKDPESTNNKCEDGGYGNPERPASAEVYRTNQSSATFSNKWAKDFHVSPFNSRKGSYTLNAFDPFFPKMSGSGVVNNTATLSSSKGHVKLVARIFSTQDSIDPSSLSGWERLRFVAAWWWVGFVTFPRIVREAGKLFFRRRLHVWYRPEVLKDSIGRRETVDERIIEQCFRDFLRSHVENSNLEVPLKYTSATSIGPN
ncbi:hypothetical protein MMC29_004449, partial [Sticta canariensis]|nr:hypothetical protein [Sticta canariensis]